MKAKYLTITAAVGALYLASLALADDKWVDSYNPQTVEIKAPWYADNQGNIVVNAGWFETLYDQGGLEAIPGASWQCRQSLHDAPEDAIVLCIKPRRDKPVNEPTPSFDDLMRSGGQR